jgi:hypothetical protein
MSPSNENEIRDFVNRLDECSLGGTLTRAQAARIFFELNNRAWELLSERPEFATELIFELQPLIIKVREEGGAT